MARKDAYPGFRDRLRQKHPLRGLFHCIPAFQVSEQLSHLPLDYLMIEAEHAATSLPVLHGQVAAVAGRMPVLIRTASGTAGVLKPILDLGVTGIMVPDIRSAAEAQEVVDQTRFAPDGKRGIGGSIRASRYGMDRGYFSDGPTEPFTVVLQVESPQGLDEIAAIAAIDGVDAIFFGPMDLSAHLGCAGRTEAPAVVDAIQQGIAALKGSDVAIGILCAPDKLPFWHAEGVSLFLLGSDIGLLNGAVSSLMAADIHGRQSGHADE